MSTPSPETIRPPGDHGTAMQAINFALRHACGEEATFLRCWTEGDLGEWPEFYQWLVGAPE